MNSKYRLVYINGLIDRNKRHVFSVDSGKFSNCDVCWTCGFFDIESEICFLSWEDASNKASTELVAENHTTAQQYYVPVPIKKPAWFRCMWWRGNG